jgi:hypothetical protein
LVSRSVIARSQFGPTLAEAVARQTIGFREGLCPHFVEQLQVLSREPASDWHRIIGHHLVKSRHADAEIFSSLDARETAPAKRGRKATDKVRGHRAVFAP